MSEIPTVDESFAILHRAGWSIGDVKLLCPRGTCWLVSGTRGGERIEAEGLTQREAWANAAELMTHPK